MDGATITQLTQFGAAGLIGLMWLMERRHAVHRERLLDEAHRALMKNQTELAALLEVVRDNTRAMVALEEGQRRIAEIVRETAHTRTARAEHAA